MDITLPPQLEAMVRERVASGRYNNASEVVHDALRLLDDHDHARYEAFKAAVNKGLASIDRGEGAEFTPELRERMNQNAIRKAREGRKPNPDVCP